MKGNNTRHAKLIIPAALLLAVVFLIIYVVSGIRSTNSGKYKYESYDYFDTITEIAIYDKLSKAEEEKMRELIDERLTYYHRIFDIYHNYDGINNAKTINDNAGNGEPIEVPEELYNLIQASQVMYNQLGGKVNIALGPVTSIWQRYREEGKRLPKVTELVHSAKNTSIFQVLANEKDKTVRLADAEMSIDLGSIAKGYAAQLIAEDLIDNGIDNALISLGGNIVAVGDKNGEYYSVGIEDPENANTPKVVLNVSNISVVTSGDYQRYYEVNGKRYCHIIDPDTLFPAEYCRSVTVVCPSSLTADALATALFNMDYESGYRLVFGMDNVEAMWIMQDGTVKYSNKFEQYLK